MIILAEADAETLDRHARRLTAEGWVAMTMTDGERALAAIREVEPAVVVVDAFLPVSEGFTLITAIQRMEDRPRIIAISGGWGRDPQADVVEEARALGADVVLRKPIDPPTLVEAVRGLLSDPAR